MRTTKELAEVLGVSEAALREIRGRLAEGAHYVRGEDRRRVVWTPAGEEAARAALGLEDDDCPMIGPVAGVAPGADGGGLGVAEGVGLSGLVAPATAAAAVPPEDVLAGEVRAVVVSSGRQGGPHFPNEHIVRVRAGGDVLDVWVRSSRSFTQGMEVEITKRGGRWELADGRRCPRWPGKW